MPIKEGYISELQALEIASTHNRKSVCMKTVTNRRREFMAEKTGSGKYIYKESEVLRAWPNGTYRTDKKKVEDSIIKNVELTHKGRCGELHFHNCNVTIHISK